MINNENIFNMMHYEYILYSKILYDVTLHLENSANLFIISQKDKSTYLKQIDKIIKIMNNEHDEYIKAIECKICKNNKLIYIYTDIYFLIKLCYNNKTFLKRTFIEILLLTKKIGCNSLKDLVLIIFGINYELLFPQNLINILLELNLFVIPISYNIISINNDLAENICIKNNTDTDNKIINSNIKDIKIYNSNKKNILLLNNIIDIHIINNDTYIIINAYVKNDSINILIKTSQICYKYMYSIKKKLHDNMDKIVFIDSTFKKNYIKSISLYDILVFEEIDFMKQIKKEYDIYLSLQNMDCLEVMEKFTNSNDIITMYKIIKYLLFGKDEHVKIACFLYNYLKNNIGIESKIATIINNNLPYFLQIKYKKTSNNIKTELSKLKISDINSTKNLENRIMCCTNMPPDVKKIALGKLKEFNNSSDNYKYLLYITSLLNFPWENDSVSLFYKNDKIISSLIPTLNEHIYGHGDVKDEIQQLIGKLYVNSSASGTVIGLVGPPGVGKTLMAKTIGKILDIPFIQITLGGQNDGDLLHGHSFTYNASQPGLIIKKIIEAKTTRCIIYFDELDKTCKKNDSNEIFNILIHLTDKNTCNTFQDRFFNEITFHLAKTIIIFSYNNSDSIDPILRDRIHEINIDPYSLQDKLQIAKSFLIPEIKKTLNNINIDIDNDSIRYVIENYTNEAGVRSLIRKMEKIFLKLNIDNIYKRGIFENHDSNKSISINIDIITDILNKPKCLKQEINSKSCVGVINGLYATSYGDGGLIKIQISNNYMKNNNFSFIYTGNQGKIMMESINVAFTTSINIMKQLNIDHNLDNFKYGFHIHIPDLATPKDGPSAGCALAICFISIILNKEIKNNIAITGEIELSGSISPIGGLIQKLNGAKKANVNVVYVPRSNSADVEKILSNDNTIISETFNIIYFDSIIDILKDIIIDF